MNIATSVQQSRELLALGADPATADFRWQVIEKHCDKRSNLLCANYALVQIRGAKVDHEGNGELDIAFTPPEMRHDDVPAWSLQALVSLLPPNIVRHENDTDVNYKLTMERWLDPEDNELYWACYYRSLDGDAIFEFGSDSLFEAVLQQALFITKCNNEK